MSVREKKTGRHVNASVPDGWDGVGGTMDAMEGCDGCRVRPNGLRLEDQGEGHAARGGYDCALRKESTGRRWMPGQKSDNQRERNG